MVGLNLWPKFPAFDSYYLEFLPCYLGGTASIPKPVLLFRARPLGSQLGDVSPFPLFSPCLFLSFRFRLAPRSFFSGDYALGRIFSPWFNFASGIAS